MGLRLYALKVTLLITKVFCDKLTAQLALNRNIISVKTNKDANKVFMVNFILPF